MKTLNIRPHHLLCLHVASDDIRDYYSRRFMENMKRISEIIRENPETMIKLVRQADDICMACPNNDNGVCVMKPWMDEFVKRLDEKVLHIAGLKSGQVLMAKEAFASVDSKINADKIPEVCSGCIWLEKGCAEDYRSGVIS